MKIIWFPHFYYPSDHAEKMYLLATGDEIDKTWFT
jgi:hypothetical protein